MSVRVFSKVWDNFPGGGADLLTILALADWCNDQGGNLFPSINAIAKKTRVSRSQAQRNIHRLIESGYVSVIGNETGGPPGSTRQYQINLNMLTGRVDATPTGRTDATGTGSTHATGSMDATGRMDAQEGSHGCVKTGRMDAALTVSEPSTTVREIAQALSCPVEAVVAAYHRQMPDNPKCKVINTARRGAIKARWNEAAKLTFSPFGYSTTTDGLRAWEAFFATCAESSFLTGRATPQPGRPPFIADIDFLMAPSSFAKCIENKYHREAA
ncbi:MAG: helix-turn-helix domain-containing protein [Sulfuritalea sp.]|nr:helix-turn-helix domain-containing protein [Sulfuritalea sp.]